MTQPLLYLISCDGLITFGFSADPEATAASFAAAHEKPSFVVRRWDMGDADVKHDTLRDMIALSMREYKVKDDWYEIGDDDAIIAIGRVQAVLDLKFIDRDAIKRGGAKVKGSKTTKGLVSIRLDLDLLTWLKKDGAGWQTRVNAYLRERMDADQR